MDSSHLNFPKPLSPLWYRQRGKPGMLLGFPMNCWAHSCSNHSQVHFQSTPGGDFTQSISVTLLICHKPLGL